MKRFVEGEDRKQGILLPDHLDDFVSEDNPVRVIDAFVDHLDLSALEFEGINPPATGRPSYHPAVLLKIYIYGYVNRLQSSRRLERETQRNIELMWLRLVGCRVDTEPGLLGALDLRIEFVQADDICGTPLAGEQPVVANAVEAARQDVREKAPDELFGRQRQGLDPACARHLAASAIILPANGDVVAVEVEEAAVGNRHAMGVAREIGEHGFWPGAEAFDISDPLASAWRSEGGLEGVIAGKGGAWWSALQTTSYFARAGEPSSPTDLADHQAVVLEQRGTGAAWTSRKENTEVAVVVQGRLRVTAGEGLRAAVLASTGLAGSSEWLFSSELASGQVCKVMQDWTLPPLDLSAVFPTGRLASAKSRAFTTYIERVLHNARTSGK